MRKFGLIVDSSVQTECIQSIFKDTSVVSLFFMKDDQVLKDSAVDFESFQVLNQEKISILPPKVEDIIESFHFQKNLGYDAVILLLSNNYFSHVRQQAALAQAILKDQTLIIIDTKQISTGLHDLICVLDEYQDESLLNLQKRLLEHVSQTKTLMYTSKLSPIKQSWLEKVLPYKYILNLNDDIAIEKKFFFEKGLIEYLKLSIQNELKKGNKPYLRMAFSHKKDAKILQQELFTLFKIPIYLDSYLPNALVYAFPQTKYCFTIGTFKE